MKNRFLILSLLIFSHEIYAQNLIPYRKNSKWGFANSEGEIIIRPQYDRVDGFDKSNLAVFYEGDLCGIINKNGEEILPATYTTIFSFSNGLAAACKGGKYHWLQGEILDGKWGFINEKGEEVIPFDYYRVQGFNGEYAIVQKENNWSNWGVIDKNNKLILPYKYPTYSFDMRPFAGLIWDPTEKGKLLYRPSQSDKVWKQIDLKGKLTGKKVDDLHGFSSDKIENLPTCEQKNGKYALKSSSGKLLTGYDFEEYIEFYSNSNYAVIKQNNKYGLIDSKGKIIIPIENEILEIKYDKLKIKKNESYFFCEINGISVMDGMNNDFSIIHPTIIAEKKENGYQLINIDGKKLNDQLYENVGTNFSEGMIQVKLNEKWGFIDSTGKQIIPCKYPSITNFENGLANVQMYNPKTNRLIDSYINKNGVEFFENTKKLYVKMDNSIYSILDKYQIPILSDLEFAQELDNGKIIYKKSDNSYNIMDENNSAYLKRRYNEILSFSVQNSDPDILSSQYYIGFTNDSSFIYNEDLIEKVALLKDINFKSFEFIQQNGMVIKKDDEGYFIVNLDGEILTKKYVKLTHVEKDIFIAKTKDKLNGLIRATDEIIIPFSKNNLFIDSDNVLISSSFSGKRLINVDFYNFEGKKLNDFKINNYLKDYSVPGLYKIKNITGKTIKNGYVFKGIISPLIYDEIKSFEMGGKKLLSVKSNNEINIIDVLTLEKIAGPFESIYNEYNLMQFTIKGKIGLMGIKNGELELLLSASYDDIPNFGYQSKLPVYYAVKKDGKYFYVNQKEESVFKLEFDDASQFTNNMAFAIINGKMGYLDVNGKWLIQPNYDYLDYEYNLDGKIIFFGRKNKSYVLLNEDGENILPENIDSLNFDYLENDHFFALNEEGKMALINFSGHLLSEIKYDEIIPFYTQNETDNFIFYIAKQNKKYGILNKLGKEITPIIYDDFEYDDDNYISGLLNVIEVKLNGKYGLVSFTGEQLLPCEYDYFDWYYDGPEDAKVVPVKKKGKWGLIGPLGKIIIEPIYDELFMDYDIMDLLLLENQLLFSVKKEGKKGVISKNGEIILPCLYKSISYNYNCDNHSILLQEGKKFGVYENGKIIIPTKYDKIACDFYLDKLFYVTTLNKKFQFFNVEGIPLNDKSYDKYQWDGEYYLANVYRDKKWYSLDAQGNEALIEE